MAQDRASVAGKALSIAEKTSLLVIGAGPAGLAAAIEAARRGIAVTLVDENPFRSRPWARNYRCISASAWAASSGTAQP